MVQHWIPVDAQSKLNIVKKFKSRKGGHVNVLCTPSLNRVSTWINLCETID